MLLSFDNILAETPNAFLFLFDVREVWIPKSAIHEPEFLTVDDGAGEVEIEEWLALREALEEFEV